MSAIVKGFTQIQNEAEAVSQIAKQILKDDTVFTVLFVSDLYDLKVLGDEINRIFGTQVVACTTSGEISGSGYSDHSISGMSFSNRNFEIDPIYIKDLKQATEADIRKIESTISKVENNLYVYLKPSKTFCMMLIDGLSGKEEYWSETVGNRLNDTVMVGGSAGDRLNFKQTFLLIDGEFVSNAGAFLFFSSNIPFETFKIQHYDISDKKLVITESDPDKRIVYEINGEPAAIAYAQALDKSLDKVTSDDFWKNPLVLNIADSCYVRSIQTINADNSLTFYCAIENGLVLSLGKREDLVQNFQKYFEQIQKKLGTVEGSVFFECVLRKAEVQSLEQGELKKLQSMYNSLGVVGFHTYGEQFRSIHINQTLTGVCFGKQG